MISATSLQMSHLSTKTATQTSSLITNSTSEKYTRCVR